jgi:predicted transposase YbfD/YdcC
MEINENNGFLSCFGSLEDPRVERTKLHPLIEILFIVICGSICGADSWRDYVDFGKSKLNYLRKFFPYKNGIPSKNTFARVMSAIKPNEFKGRFLEWMKIIQTNLAEVIAIDGKALRGSFDNSIGQSSIYLVNAFATSLKLVLAQEKVSEKSNEITAIPELLNILEVKGAIISIDAMGCQKEVAKKIREKEADYVLALKGNQGNLHEDVKFFLEAEVAKGTSNKIATYEEIDGDHGRVVTRRYYVSDKIDWLEQKNKWKDLKSIVMVESTREIKNIKSKENRFYITSLSPNPRLIAHAIRSHWGIESLHWVLDVTFCEDDSRIREKNAVENMGLVRKIVFNILQTAKKKFKDMSIRRLRKKSGWDYDTLDTVLNTKLNDG